MRAQARDWVAPPEGLKEYFSVTEAAAISGISKGKIYQLLREGRWQGLVKDQVFRVWWGEVYPHLLPKEERA